MLVVDASVALSLIMDDEAEHLGDAFLKSLLDHDPIAPTLFWYEVRNALIMNERRKRHSTEDTAAFLSELRRLHIRIERSICSDHILTLAREHDLTVYDASYLSLAIKESAVLSSLDLKLNTAAEAENVELLPVLSSAA